MTQAEEIKVELEILSELRYQLLKAREYLDELAEKACQVIEQESNRLTQVRDQFQQEVDKCKEEVDACQADLDACLACADEDGNHPNCSEPAAVLRQAQESLRRAQQALKEVNAHIANFQSQAEKTMQEVNSQKKTMVADLDTAYQALGDRIQKTIQYLKGADIAIPATPGQSAHGAEYQTARRRYYQEATDGDYVNIPTHIRGWMQQEVNRGGYYRSPYGWRGPQAPDGTYPDRVQPPYHVGHVLRNLNIPENFRPELAIDNQARTYWRTRGMNNY